MAYVKWAHAAGEQGPNGEQLRRREDFFTSNMCRTWFKQFVSMMLSRTNTVTQTSYRDDASIFAWELINEPRVMGDGSGDTLQEWIEDMSAFAKGLDEKHLLTMGSEGFYGSWSADSQRKDENPVNWAETMGGDFTRNFQTRSLDFACIHIWVDLWLCCDEVCKLKFAERWIARHLEASRDGFDKPVLLEEFGKWKPLDFRDAFFRKTFQVSLPPNSPVSSHAGGSLFWHMDPTKYPYNEDGFSVQAEVESTVAGIISLAATQAYAADSPAANAAQKQQPPKAPGTASLSSSDASESAELPDATSGASPGTNYRSPSSSSSSPSSPLPDATSGASPVPKYRSPSASSRGTGSSAPSTLRYTFDSVPDWGNKNAPASSIPTPFEDVDTEGNP
jgi:mannan endo-1,4-beta-mannosidase